MAPKIHSGIVNSSDDSVRSQVFPELSVRPESAPAGHVINDDTEDKMRAIRRMNALQAAGFVDEEESSGPNRTTAALLAASSVVSLLALRGLFSLVSQLF